MKKITIFTKTLIILFILANINACKKDETPTAATPTTIINDLCKISKIDYGDGDYETYTFNNAGFVTQEDNFYKDTNGKIQQSSATFSYDASGLVIGSKYNGGSEKYSYVNGALSTIEVFDDKNQSIYKITVTTDANKRIIGMKDSNNITAKITRDAQGNFTKSEVFDEKNNLIQREEISSYDGKKNWRSSLKGWSIDLSLPNQYYIYYGGYFNEPSGGSNDDKLYSAMDSNGKYTGKLALIENYTFTKQFNSKGFPTQIILKDLLNGGNNSTRTYSYSDCQ